MPTPSYRLVKARQPGGDKQRIEDAFLATRIRRLADAGSGCSPAAEPFVETDAAEARLAQTVRASTPRPGRPNIGFRGRARPHAVRRSLFFPWAAISTMPLRGAASATSATMAATSSAAMAGTGRRHEATDKITTGAHVC